VEFWSFSWCERRKRNFQRERCLGDTGRQSLLLARLRERRIRNRRRPEKIQSRRAMNPKPRGLSASYTLSLRKRWTKRKSL
jgi:uncharacterized protein with von Willebrand factor type A (vWA) domain